jgi:type I restriction enzyme M protein
MANPPFMTPKGGIIPHQHFSVQAKRSEVLFVDYIAEHLLQNGRAGVIVPDGIIFRSSDAYKALRKMLVDNYLYAVVFLPAGVFNPYAGVKTSILLMDKRLARMTDSILFVKVENDGFDLGAQRKQVTGSDLPEATKAIEEFKKAVLAGQAVCSSALALVVQKSEIAANGDYNLSAERYREADTQCHKWPMVELGNLEIFDIKSGGTPDSENDSYWNGSISWATLVDLPQENHISAITSTKRTISEFGLKNSSANLLPIHSILVSSRATIGRVAINEIELATNQGFKNIVIKDKHKANYRYVAYVVKTLENKMNELASGGTFKEISKTSFSLLKIPLPPLPTQQEIVAEIEGYQKIIDGARQVVENYKPQIKIDPAWPMVELGEISTVTSSKRIFESEYVSEGIPFYRTKEVVELSQNKPISLELFISNDRYESIKRDFGVPQKGDLLISAVGTIGISWLIPDARQFYFKDGNLLWIKDISSIRPNYLKHMLDVILLNDLDKYINGAAYKALTIVVLKRLKIPLPKLVQQDQIVAQIEKEQALVNASKQLIAIYEQKIKDKIAEVWGGAV